MFLARPRAAHCAILGRPEERLFPARRHSQIHELSFVDPHLIQSNSCSNTPPRSDDLYRQSDITILNGSSNTPPRSDDLHRQSDQKIDSAKTKDRQRQNKSRRQLTSTEATPIKTCAYTYTHIYTHLAQSNFRLPPAHAASNNIPHRGFRHMVPLSTPRPPAKLNLPSYHSSV